jgi:hypothetical protein
MAQDNERASAALSQVHANTIRLGAQHAKVCAQRDLSRRNSQNSKQIHQLQDYLPAQDSGVWWRCRA